jgi:L-alanine-DL-glutamate epimerase-like enolase superfamily enzyme
MKIKHAKLLPLDIPFVEQFAHATKTRRSSDAVLLKITMEDGTIGWGETLVRPYLTGETVELLVNTFQKHSSDFGAANWCLALDAPNAEGKIAPITTELDSILAQIELPDSVRSWNGLRCLWELAIVDAELRRNKMGLWDVLTPMCKEVVYSGVISAEDPEKSLKIARQLRLLGIQHYKLKVTPATAVDLVRHVRAAIGEGSSLRLDANASFTLDSALAFCGAVEPLNIAAIEEPLIQATPQTLSALQRQTTIPIMSDENLVTFGDAQKLISNQSARMFNIRLAKCGGISSCLAIAKLAQKAGIALQLGALVGETAILSSVGRSLAASIRDFCFVEGSYGTLLLKEDVAQQSIRFGHGGRAPLLRGIGHNVSIVEEVVNKYAQPHLVRHLDFSL